MSAAWRWVAWVPKGGRDGDAETVHAKDKEILRQKWALGRSNREVARSVGVGPTTVGDVERRARSARLGWTDVEQLGEEELETRLYPPAVLTRRDRGAPDWPHLHAERRRPGVTLELLHLEYLEKNPDGWRYSTFCQRYQTWAKTRSVTMRQVHRAGEKLFVDYAGKKPCIWDAATGERIEVELFIAVLGASNYTYVEATRTQRGPDFIASHVRAFDFMGGVPEAVVPDQLRSGVSRPCRYSPASSVPTKRWRSTTARRCCPLDRRIHGTKPRSK